MLCSDLIQKIRFVLVNTTDPGNIGAVARALKTMGLRRLYLVNPKHFPHPQASLRASNALDVLAEAIVVDSLDEALQGCHFVLGTSTRPRELNWVSFTARAAAEKVATWVPQHEIALLFGRERHGLTNEELQRCHFQLTIPANPDYSSLNLAAAVQIVAYELQLALQTPVMVATKPKVLAAVDQLELLYEHINTVLDEVDFLKPRRSQQIIGRLRRLFSRVELETIEVKLLRGILSAIQKKIAFSVKGQSKEKENECQSVYNSPD